MCFEMYNPAGPPWLFWQFLLLIQSVLHFVLYVFHFTEMYLALKLNAQSEKMTECNLKAIQLKWRPLLPFTARRFCVISLYISLSLHIWIGRNSSFVDSNDFWAAIINLISYRLPFFSKHYTFKFNILHITPLMTEDTLNWTFLLIFELNTSQVLGKNMSDLTQYFSVELYSKPKQLDDKIGNIHKENVKQASSFPGQG